MKSILQRITYYYNKTLQNAGMKEKTVKSNDSLTYTFNDEFIQKDLDKRIEFLKGRNARALVEKYCKEIIKNTLEKDNYLIGYNQAMPEAVARINKERANGLLDEFYLPIEK